MNILLTGATRAHTNTYKIRPKIKLFQPNQLVHDLLVDMGHTVEWRRSKVGESLDGIDFVVCILSPVNSPASRRALSMLWTIHQAKVKRIPIIYYYEDWGPSGGLSGMKTFGNNTLKQVYRKFGGEYFFEDLEEVEKHGVLEELQALARDFVTPNGEYVTRGQGVIPAFTNFGDRSILTDKFLHKEEPMIFDYSPLIRSYVDLKSLPEYQSREEKWVMPGLHYEDAWTSKLNNQWEIEYVGQKGERALPRVNESEVGALISSYKAVLSPPTVHAGSGWHRMRFMYAAVTQTYLWPGEVDARMYLENDSKYIVPPGEFEELRPETQERVGRYVAAVLREHMVVDPRVAYRQFEEAMAMAKERA